MVPVGWSSDGAEVVAAAEEVGAALLDATWEDDAASVDDWAAVEDGAGVYATLDEGAAEEEATTIELEE